jgi:hypothetical protein
LGKSAEAFTLSPKPGEVRKIPRHANPPGFAGPVGRSGKVNGAAAADAGFSNDETAIAFAARAVLSSLAVISLTAVS